MSNGGKRFAPAVRLTGTRNDCTQAETVIATRYDRTPDNYRATLTIAASLTRLT